MRFSTSLLVALCAALSLSGPDGPRESQTATVRGPSFSLHATGDRVDLADARDDSARVGFRLRSVLGPDAREIELAEAHVRSGERGLWIEREPVTAFYLVGDRAVEQGFTLAEPPSSERGFVSLILDVFGLEPRLENEDRIVLVDAAETPRLRYGVVHVRDRDGRELPATLAVEDSRIALRYDDRGARYPVVVDPAVWSVSSEIGPVSPMSNSEFGAAIAIAGDVAVVGAPGYSGTGLTDQGAAYVFERVALGDWQYLATLAPTTERAGARFGASVAASLVDTVVRVVVGAPGDSNGTTTTGMAYVFERSGPTSATFTRSELAPTLSGITTSDKFGTSVAIAGDRVVVGAPDLGASREGGAELFEKPGVGPWASKAYLTPSTDPAPHDRFGTSVAIAGTGTATEIVVGAIGVDYPVGPVVSFGAVYLFTTTDGMTWTEAATIPSPPTLAITSPIASSRFGAAVAFDGETLLVGAPDMHVAGTTLSGAAYVFDTSGAQPTGLAELLANPPLAYGRAGESVAFAGDRFVVGAPGASNSKGVALVYTRMGPPPFTEETIALGAAGVVSDLLGSSVAIFDQETLQEVLVGAKGRTYGSTVSAGAVAVATYGSSLGTPCTTDDECALGHCVDDVCCESACGGGSATDCMVCNAQGMCDTSACDGTDGRYPDPRVASCSTFPPSAAGFGASLFVVLSLLRLASRRRRGRPGRHG
jgi:hypothetical protein